MQKKRAWQVETDGGPSDAGPEMHKNRKYELSCKSGDGVKSADV